MNYRYSLDSFSIANCKGNIIYTDLIHKFLNMKSNTKLSYVMTLWILMLQGEQFLWHVYIVLFLSQFISVFFLFHKGYAVSSYSLSRFLNPINLGIKPALNIYSGLNPAPNMKPTFNVPKPLNGFDPLFNSINMNKSFFVLANMAWELFLGNF